MERVLTYVLPENEPSWLKELVSIVMNLPVLQIVLLFRTAVIHFYPGRESFFLYFWPRSSIGPYAVVETQDLASLPASVCFIDDEWPKR
jgi:hypothetical protein